MTLAGGKASKKMQRSVSWQHFMHQKQKKTKLHLSTAQKKNSFLTCNQPTTWSLRVVCPCHSRHIVVAYGSERRQKNTSPPWPLYLLGSRAHFMLTFIPCLNPDKNVSPVAGLMSCHPSGCSWEQFPQCTFEEQNSYKLKRGFSLKGTGF